jgi:hypothetical protein
MKRNNVQTCQLRTPSLVTQRVRAPGFLGRKVAEASHDVDQGLNLAPVHVLVQYTGLEIQVGWQPVRDTRLARIATRPSEN